MKIPLIMHQQYQGQRSASMLCYCFMQNRFYGRFFFLRRLFLNPKNKNTAISCGVDFKMVNLTRVPANIKFKIYATHFDAIFAFCKKKNKKKSI